jgi:arylsulfatase A-like enzyme
VPPGPFDRWPVGKGFDYWYGFQGGEASQWHTPLFENTAPIEPPHDDPDWHFSEAIAAKAISWISQQKAGAPEKPFFVYFAPAPATARTTWQRNGPTSTREIRSRLGSPARDHLRKSEEARSRSEEHEAHAAARLHPVLGVAFSR